MRVLVIILIIFLLSFATTVNAQKSGDIIIENKSVEKLSGIDEVKNSNENLKVPVINAEPNPSPEEQGFIKTILSDGKYIYRKQVNGIIIEYLPD
jgi:hypothetical protein